ncbi:hypothetical protein [Rhizobium fabae]|uniref:Uncharacterized protein n=1 Tax=Rhizobium fabae TaxID=573179 RepID=A0A7W6BBY0_9HYPH|nr:hypothetical protein [Rhizobium fabae]MBB3916022.1 hypothetical protein [Rhizobium fabae]RUM11043.1 hypothetical protein EFB14_19355 [Rhizobium fabae]
MWLDDDPDHAIWSTVHELVWRDTQFATIAQLARDNPDGPLNTSLIAEALIGGQVAQQVMAIRRLTDRTRNRISLWRLITDVKGSLHLMTRENFVCHDGLPYDYAAVSAAERADRVPGIAFWGPTSGPKAWCTSARAHEQFDRVAGISPDDRQRDDVIPKSVFVRLENMLASSGASRIADWSHAFLAHAGAQVDRKSVDNVKVGNDKISAAIRELTRITEYLSSEVLWIGGYGSSLISTAQYDVFEKLENPVAPQDRQQDAAAVWQQKTSDWDEALAGVEDLLSPPEG